MTTILNQCDEEEKFRVANPFKKLSDEVLADPVRRARVEEIERATDVVLRLAKLRESRQATQRQLADQLSVSQANVSRIEHESDVYLSTLRNYVEALGGRLEIAAIFDDERFVLIEKFDSEVAVPR